MLRHIAIALVLIASTAAPSASAEKLTVLLDWFANPDHAPLYVAQGLGYFADAGLEVELIAPADPNGEWVAQLYKKA